MIVLGLTGGIGSGKTTVANIFKEFGIPVYNSDERAKWIMNNDPDLKNKLIELFGREAYLNGKLNRKFIASKVFKSPELLKKLNDLVHPRVGSDFERWKNNQISDILLKEAAILIESGAYKQVDKLIVVSAPKDIRVKRVIERDQSSEEEVYNRIDNQISEEERLKVADFIIKNDGEHLLIPQVKEIINKLKA